MKGSRENVLAALATIAATGTVGVITGFMLGCTLAIPLAEVHLKKYLERVASQDNATLQEAQNLLAGLKHSAKPPCSDAELGAFRDLVFQADYVRDAGRMHGGRIECSAAQGRPLRPIGLFQAGPTSADATAAEGSPAPIYDRELKRAGIQEGDLFVVFGSELPTVEGSLPVHLAVDAYGAVSSGLSDQGSMEALENEANDDVERRGDTLTAKHCSPLLSNCVTASLSVGEAQRGELAAISGTSALGGIAGALLGAALCLLRRRSRSMHRQLRRAVAEERLHLAYQPIVNLSDGKIVGAEALARWTTDDGSSVEPEVFIKVAEEHGFIGSITNFVLRRALKEFREVFEKIPGFHLNINIAAADLVDPKFLPMLGQVVSEAKVRPSNLVLEVTESSTASRDDAMESIRSLRERGYGIYIDDFGTGYSNLSYLLYLSVDKIKIDRAFVRAIGSESVTVAILPQIIAMARSMNLGVVVEGIESERQAHYFSSDDVKVDAQGFLFGRPIPATEFLKLVGLAGDRPEIEGNPEAAAVPGPWGRLASEVQAAIVR